MIQPLEQRHVDPSDGALLARFVTRRDQDAFAQLVRRHGGMVVGVCRSVLGNTSDAEDAAQAVFLTLAQRASSLQNRSTLVGWLHRVAWYVAAREAQAAAIRRRHEQEAVRMRKPLTQTRESDAPLDLLHAGLESLSEKYRVPLLLHHVEGRTLEETAALLGCNTSTASMRLTRGRQMLRDRLVKQGIAVSAVGMIAALAGRASAGVAPTFVTSVSQLAVSVAAGNAVAAGTSGSIAALSKGALNMLFWAKMKLAAVIGAAVITGGAGAVVIQQTLASPAKPAAVAPVPSMVALPVTLVPQQNAPSVTQPTAGAVQIRDRQWGSPVEGIRSSLRLDNPFSPADQIPALRIDLQNEGTRQSLSVVEGQRNCQLEVDGRWYVWPIQLRRGRMLPVDIGQVIGDTVVTISPIWQEATEEDCDGAAGAEVEREFPNTPDTWS